MRFLLISALTGALSCIPRFAAAQDDLARHHPRLCELIETEADKNRLPRDFFARLIWKESRFDLKAVSPVGAQGVAQFMPATAKAVGLADPFDMEQAIPASARHLAELRDAHGNLGLAAAAYNAGEGRLGQWLNGGFLPLETENYVLDITGEPADVFMQRGREVKPRPLEGAADFRAACLKLPVMMTRSPSMAETIRKPWFIQVAGGFNRAAMARRWERLRPQMASIIGDNPAGLSRTRSPMGRKALYTVRIGADSRAEANRICAALKAKGDACIVLKTR
ncbi:MAG: lytic transglycosylase domain-containing protein [Rhizobiaceae bacterium]|nr:lytic transglycosylase domain-containing protein [Rhizobiaceae bacterium]